MRAFAFVLSGCKTLMACFLCDGSSFLKLDLHPHIRGIESQLSLTVTTVAS